jgi:Holliday junction resolvasome RuvABC endonuclease subunit
MLAGSILFFDFAQSTGYAWGKPGDVPRFASHLFASTGDNYGRHNANIRSWLRHLIFEVDPVLIGYESPSIFKKTTPATVRKLAAYCAVLEEECLREGFNIPVREVNPSSMKLFFTRNGKAKKDQMETQARRFGFRVSNDDEADAIAGWFFMIEQMGSAEQKQQFRQMQFEAQMGVKQGAKF